MDGYHAATSRVENLPQVLSCYLKFVHAAACFINNLFQWKHCFTYHLGRHKMFLEKQKKLQAFLIFQFTNVYKAIVWACLQPSFSKVVLIIITYNNLGHLVRMIYFYFRWWVFRWWRCTPSCSPRSTTRSCSPSCSWDRWSPPSGVDVGKLVLFVIDTPDK